LKAKAELAEKEAKRVEANNAKAIEMAKQEMEADLAKPLEVQLTKWVESFKLPDAPAFNDETTLIINKFEAFKLWALKQL
jgi:hypothetical protein